MPDIAPIGHGSVGPIEWHAPVARREVTPDNPVGGKPPVRPGDRVEVSEQARLLERLHHLPPVRQDRIDAVRQAIDAGQYETTAKLDSAIERLAQDLS